MKFTKTSQPAASPMASGRKAIRPARILVPVDFSRESEKAFKYAVALAGRFGSSVVLVHVVEPVAYPADFGYGPMALEFPDKDAAPKLWSRLNALAKKFADAKLPVYTEVLNGAAHHEITRTARALNIDLIVIGTHGYTGLDHALMGSTAERVVRHAPCPVLVVRQREREFVQAATRG